MARSDRSIEPSAGQGWENSIARYLGIAEKVSDFDNRRKWRYGGISERSLNIDRESTYNIWRLAADVTGSIGKYFINNPGRSPHL